MGDFWFDFTEMIRRDLLRRLEQAVNFYAQWTHLREIDAECENAGLKAISIAVPGVPVKLLLRRVSEFEFAVNSFTRDCFRPSVDEDFYRLARRDLQ